MTAMPPLRIGIVVGELSGDALGAKLIPALRAQFYNRELVFCGVSGPSMTREGVVSLFPLEEIAVMGIVPVLKRLPALLRRIRETATALLAFRPNLLILIDSPDFTHRVAKRVRAVMGDLPVVDYVSPSVWAWRPGRAKAMAEYIDQVLAILPFEPEAHRRLSGPACTYVGHPLIERLDVLRPNSIELDQRNTEPPSVVVLPGSRRSEIIRMMPVFRNTLVSVTEAYGRPISFILPAVEHLRSEIERQIADWPIKPILVAGESEKYRAFRGARAALAASGTVTLELALAQVPMVVGYRVGALEGQIRHLISVSSIVLANLIIGENVVPERIQGTCNAAQLTADLLPLLHNGIERRRQMAGFAALDTAMAIGDEWPSAKAAKVIAGVLDHPDRR